MMKKRTWKEWKDVFAKEGKTVLDDDSGYLENAVIGELEAKHGLSRCTTQSMIKPQELQQKEEIMLPAGLMMIFQSARPQLASTHRVPVTYTAEEHYQIARTIGSLAELIMKLKDELQDREAFINQMIDKAQEARTKFANALNTELNDIFRLDQERRKNAAEQQDNGR